MPIRISNTIGIIGRVRVKTTIRKTASSYSLESGRAVSMVMLAARLSSYWPRWKCRAKRVWDGLSGRGIRKSRALSGHYKRRSPLIGSTNLIIHANFIIILNVII